MKKNHAGFALLEIIAALAVLCLVGAAGYYASHHNTAVTNAGHTSSQVPTNKTSVWIAYKSAHSSLQFAYPSDWKITTHQTSGYNLENVTLAGPNNFQMDYELQTNHADTGASCTAATYGSAVPLANQYVIVPTLDPTNNSNISSLNLMTAAYKNAADTSGCELGFYPNPTGATMGFVFAASYMQNGKAVSKPAATYFSLPEVQTARAIFESMKL